MAPQEIEKPIKITLILPTQAYFTSGVREFALNFIKNTTQFGDMWAYRFQSIVDELCNNAIEFGSTSGENIILTFVYDGKSMEISVEDTGTGSQKTTAKQIEKIVEERKKPTYENKEIRGRGLSKIVANWTDELHFEDLPKGGIKATAKKYLGQEKNQAGLQMESKTHIILQ